MIERITEEEERASEAIANLAGRNGISFKPLSPSSNDIRTLEHEGLFSKTENMIAEILKISYFVAFQNRQRLHIYSSFRFFSISPTMDVRNGILQFLWQKRIVILREFTT